MARTRRTLTGGEGARPRGPKGWARVRRWAKRAALALLALLLILVAAGAIYEALGRRNAARNFPVPGRLIEIGDGRRIHLDCRGAGSPTIILESGLGAGGTKDWALVHDEMARFSRTCAYDRAGILWSDPKTSPQHAGAAARDLHAALRAAGVSGPLVLAAHSIGGPYSRVYTGLYGDQIAGLVMVDASHPDQVARFGEVVEADVHPKQAATFLNVASALFWTGIVRLLAAGNTAPKLPKEASDAITAYADRSVSGMASEIAGFDRTMSEARAVRTFGDRPLIVLTAMAPYTPDQLDTLGMTAADGARMKQVWKKLHAEIAAMSTRGRQQIVGDSGHYIQIDRPDIVIAAVRDVVAEVRADRSAVAAGSR